MTGKRQIVHSSLAVMLLCLAIPAMLNADGKRTDRPVSEALLVDCAGRYLRVDLDGQRVIAEGTVWDKSSLRTVRSYTASTFDGCEVTDAKADMSRKTLYLSLAKEPRLDANGKRHYLIAALRLPDLALMSQVELEDALETMPRLLLSEDHEKVMVSYSTHEEVDGSPIWRNTIDYLAAASLKRMHREENLSRGFTDSNLPSSMPLSASATLASGQRVLDRTFVLDLGGRVLEHIDPYRLLSPAIRERLRPAERKGATGAPYLPIAYADNAAGRTLFVVGDDLDSGRGAGGLWVHDLVGGMSPHPILISEIVAAYDPGSPETPTAHLTADGKFVLLEGFDWRQVGHASENAVNARFKTGDLRLYSVDDGSLVRRIQLEPVPGFAARVIGFSPGSDVALIGSQDMLYVVPLDDTRAPIRFRSHQGFNPFWSVGAVFVER